MDPKRVVREGYDRLDRRYAEWSSTQGVGARAWFLDVVLAHLGSASAVLELGCGPGTAAAILSDGRAYVGIDLSAGQVALARDRFPGGRFVQADIASVGLRDGSFDAVIAFFVFGHLPRAEIGPASRRIHGWLRPGGRVMLSLGARDTFDEVQDDWLGVPMFFGGFHVAMNERLMRDAGFELELSETRTEIEEGEGEATFHRVIARKSG